MQHLVLKSPHIWPNLASSFVFGFALPSSLGVALMSSAAFLIFFWLVFLVANTGFCELSDCTGAHIETFLVHLKFLRGENSVLQNF
jgi:hypothetical protein